MWDPDHKCSVYSIYIIQKQTKPLIRVIKKNSILNTLERSESEWPT